MSYDEFVRCAAFFVQAALLTALALGLLAASRLACAGKDRMPTEDTEEAGGGWFETGLRFHGVAAALSIFGAACTLLTPAVAVLREVAASARPAPVAIAFLEIACFLAVFLAAAMHLARKGRLGWIGPLREPE